MLIADTLRERLGTLATGLPIVDTVERVQGLTVEAIVVSLCAESAVKPDHAPSFAQSPNRLNVALSRGRTKAILLSAIPLNRVMSLMSERPGSSAAASS